MLEAPSSYTQQGEQQFRQQVESLKVDIDNVLARLKVDTLAAGIGELGDVVITSVATGELLAFDGTNWINQTLAELDIDIQDLGNVIVTSVAAGEVLKFNGTNWVNNTLAEAGIALASHVHAGTDITTGTVADARLSSNVALLDQAVTFTAGSVTIKESGTPRLDIIEEDFSATDRWRIASAAGDLRIQMVDRATGRFEIRRSGGTISMILDVASPTSGNTNLWIRDVGNIERVTVGATNSGGTGFKLLRLPN